jgi:ABC-2 type transport system permease protein
MSGISTMTIDRSVPPTAARRFSLLSSLWSVYALTLREHLHGRRWLAMVAVFLLPPAMVILFRSTVRDPQSIVVEFHIGFMFIPQAMLPFIALLYASGILLDEQEEQTITYLLIRPVPKWALYCIKLLATLTTTVLLTILLTLLTYSAIYFHTGTPLAEVATRFIKAAAVHCLAVAVYCALFGMLSLLTRRALVVGILYTAVVEGVFANLPFGIRFITVIYYVRLITYRLMEFIVHNSRGADDFAADAWQFDAAGDPHLASQYSTSTCLAVLFISGLFATIIAAWHCSQREFRVKTPGTD